MSKLQVHVGSVEADVEAKKKAVNELVSKINVLAAMYTYFLRTLKPSAISMSDSRSSKLSALKLRDVVSYSGRYLDVDLSTWSTLQVTSCVTGPPPSYWARNYYTALIRVEEKSGTISVAEGRKHSYLKVNGSVVDYYPPQTVRGWVIVASIYDKENNISKIVPDSIPYHIVGQNLYDLAKLHINTDRVLGYIFKIDTGKSSLFALDLKNIYSDSALPDRIRQVVYSAGGLDIILKSERSYQLVDQRDLEVFSEALSKMFVGAVAYHMMSMSELT